MCVSVVHGDPYRCADVQVSSCFVASMPLGLS